jgi:hypothetical protein
VPLIKSGSRNAISQNISEMVKAGHPRNQAIAAALSTARKFGGAGGGMRRAAAAMTAPPSPPRPKRGKRGLEIAVNEAKRFASGGKLNESGLGRLENHIPHPSGMLNSSVPGRTDKLPVSVKAGSYVVPADIPSALGEGNSMAGRKVLDRLIASYTAGSPQPDFAAGDDRDIPIIAAGGEYVVHPSHVLAIGGGDLSKGHDMLDEFVKQIRKRHIKTLRGLKPPRLD